MLKNNMCNKKNNTNKREKIKEKGTRKRQNKGYLKYKIAHRQRERIKNKN